MGRVASLVLEGGISVSRRSSPFGQWVFFGRQTGDGVGALGQDASAWEGSEEVQSS